MSTDLYGVRVLELAPEEKRVRFRIFVIYYDKANEEHQPLPQDRSFFFRILWDRGDTRFGKGGTIGDEVSVDLKVDEKFVDQNTYQFVESCKRLSTSNYPVKDYSLYSDFYSDLGGGSWKDEDLLVQADYDVYVTHNKYLDHLEEGMSWGTTSYETRADGLEVSEAESLPDPGRVAFSDICFQKSSEGQEGSHRMSFSPHSRFLALLSIKGEMVLYSLEELREVFRLEHQGKGTEMGWTPESKLWLRTRGGEKKAWEFPKDEGEGPVPIDSEIVPEGYRPSPTGKYLLAEEFGEPFLIKDWEGNEVARSQLPWDGWIDDISYNEGENRLYICGKSNSIQVYDLQEQEWREELKAPGSCFSLAVSPQEKYLAGTNYDVGYILRLSDGKVVRWWQEDSNLPANFAWSLDGKWFAVAWNSLSPTGETEVSLYRIGDYWTADCQD